MAEGSHTEREDSQKRESLSLWSFLEQNQKQLSILGIFLTLINLLRAQSALPEIYTNVLILSSMVASIIIWYEIFPKILLGVKPKINLVIFSIITLIIVGSVTSYGVEHYIGWKMGSALISVIISFGCLISITSLRISIDRHISEAIVNLYAEGYANLIASGFMVFLAAFRTDEQKREDEARRIREKEERRRREEQKLYLRMVVGSTVVFLLSLTICSSLSMELWLGILISSLLVFAISIFSPFL